MADKTTYYRDAPTTSDGVLVDLSRLYRKLMDYEDVASDLSQDEEAKIADLVRMLVDMSYGRISRRYDHWNQADRAHDVYVPPDATEFREKAVIADTRAVADTVVTYLMAALGGRNPMFQLEGQDRNSRKGAAIMERVLHQHMRRNAGEAKLAQLITDSVRYGFAPTKVVWSDKMNTNLLVNFDPRRVFPDPRVNWGEQDKSQFCVFNEWSSYDTLVQTGLYPKLDVYPQLRSPQFGSQAGWQAHQWHREKGRGLYVDPNEPTRDTYTGFFSFGDARPVDECWIRLAGYQLGMPAIKALWLVVTILDESVVIRFQLNPYGQQFPYVFGGFYNDAHKAFAQSLYDIMLPLHDIATWLLRSRVDNVQAALNNLIFADPTSVSIPDLIDRNPWGVVRTMPGVKPGEGFYVAQVPDVTRGHWQDIAAMSELKQRVSAASDNIQGMPTSDGIRSATEIQRLTQLGSQRLGVMARIMSGITVRPMVRMMVSNIQDALNQQGSVKVPEEMQGEEIKPLVKDGYLDYSIGDIQGDIHYLVVDGTLPLEPTRNAETWMAILQVANQVGLNMELDLKKMALEAIRAMGISDIEQFKINPGAEMTPSQQLQIMEKMRGASVMPEEQVNRQVERGNLVPMRRGA